MRCAPPGEVILDRYRPFVEGAIRTLVEGRPDVALYWMLRYHLGYADPEGRPVSASGGKGVRSALCLLGCQAAGGDPVSAAPAGAALELIHGFTLIHDDIADQDELRRGRPTVWALWGVGQAITAGDAMYALANLAVERADPRQVPAEIALAVMRDLNEAILQVCEGQQLDLSYQGRDDIELDEYLAMIGLKTAALFRAAASAGARIARAEDGAISALGGFGFQLGLAYQIRDDILGLWGHPGEMGKPVGGDLRQNKRSLPIVLALASGDAELRSRVAGGGASEEETVALASRMQEAGIQAKCEQLAREHLAEAVGQLDRADLAAGPKADLRTLATYLVARTR